MSRRAFLLSALFLGACVASYAALPRMRELADVPLEAPGNTTVNAREYRGKIVVLAILASTCDHCARAAEVLTRIQKELRPQGIRIIAGMADDNPKVSVPAFVARYRINFPVGFVYPELIRKLANISLGVRPYVPILIFVDPKGMVRQQYYGNDPFMVEPKMEATIRATILQMQRDGPPAAIDDLKPGIVSPAPKAPRRTSSR